MAPTGSFKDRGAALVIASLKAGGAAMIVEDSSGNAGAAMAAYAARAGWPLTFMCPPWRRRARSRRSRSTAPRCIAWKARARTWPPPRPSLRKRPGAAYASHSRHPAFVEGAKTFVLELLEDGVDALPRHFVFPVGNGGLILGAHKVLAELRQAGLQFRMPRLHIAPSGGLPAAGSGVCDGRRSAGRG